jgi:hypothetical protein
VDWLWLALLGFGTGAYGILVGAGGGFILGPALLIFFDLEPKVVAGTALAAVSINSVTAAITHRRMGFVDVRSGLLFAGAAIPGSVIAPFVLSSVGGSTFRLLFGLLLIGLAALMIFRPDVSERAEEDEGPPTSSMTGRREITTGSGEVFRYQFNEFLATLFNLVLGFLSSFFGTGGGFLRMPVLVYVFHFPVRVAVATSVFALAFYTTAGAVTHASIGHVDWYPTLVWAGLGLVAGGQVGARLAGVFKGSWILRLLLVLVLAMGVRLVIEGLRG